MSTITCHGGRSSVPGQLPDPRPYFGTGRADRGQGLRPGCRQGTDKAGDSRIRGHWAEHLRFGPKHRRIRQAIPAQSDRERDIQQGRAPPAACATEPMPLISRRPDRTCGPSRPAAPPRPARPLSGRCPRHGQTGTTRHASSPEECSFLDNDQGPRQMPSPQVRGTPRLSNQASG